MRISSTLSFYIGRQFLVGFLIALGIFLGLIALLDVLELMRRAATHEAITFRIILHLSALKLPYEVQKVFPFAVLFGGMATYWRLSRSHELEVTRAAGVSAWQFLLPALLAAFALGVFKIAIFNPVASAMLGRYEYLEARYFRGQTSSLAISSNGLWLRQGGTTGPSVIHATNVLQHGSGVELDDVTIIRYKGLDDFAGEILADRARLEPGYWLLHNVRILSPDAPTSREPTLKMPTDLTLARIQNNFASPDTMAFWELPSFIKTLERAGFSATRQRLHWHSLLASPFLMCAMVLIAATFTLRHARRSGALTIIAGGLLAGFLLYFLTDVVLALGASESIPVVLAAWTPSGVATLLGVAMLLHLEDG